MSDLTRQLREAFDESFARPPAESRETPIRLLGIRLAGRPYALRLEEVMGLVRHKKVTPLPGAPSQQLGIAGLRGHLVAVYELAALLGLGRLREQGEPWFALVRAPGDTRLALAFDVLEGQRAVSPADIVSCRERFSFGLLTGEAEPVPVLSLEAVVHSLVEGFTH